MSRSEYRPGSERLAREKKALGTSVGKVVRDLSLDESPLKLSAIDAVVSSAAGHDVVPIIPKKSKVSSEDYEKVRALVGEKGADLDLSGQSDASEQLKKRQVVILKDEIDDIGGVGLSGVKKVKRAIQESSTLTQVYTGLAALQSEFLIPMVMTKNPLSIPYGVAAGYCVYKAAKEEKLNRKTLKETKDKLRSQKEAQIVDLTQEK